MSNNNSTPPPDPFQRRADALKLALLLEAIIPLWERHFIKAISKNPSVILNKHLGSNDEFKRATSLEGMLTAIDTWRHSNLPGLRAFVLAQMKTPAELDPLTAGGRGGFLFDLSGLPEIVRPSRESYNINERRNFDALVRFGFAEKDNTKPCYRPVSALDPLDDLVFGFLEELGRL